MSLQVLALRFKQGKHTIYEFSMDAKVIHDFAVVRRLERDENGHLVGHQRGEVKQHISNIRHYLNTDESPLIPNAIVFGFRKRPKFTRLDGVEASNDGEVGMLTLTEGDAIDIIDGQQRTAAIVGCELSSFRMPITGFIAEDEAEMRDQFIRLNQTQRISGPLMNEMMASLGETFISDAVERKKVPSLLIERLNLDDDSPLRGLVKTATTDGPVLASTLMRGFAASIERGGFYEFREVEDGVGQMVATAKAFWAAVRQVFKADWADRRESKLLSAAGVLSLMALMDAMVSDSRAGTRFTEKFFADRLRTVQPHCHFSEGNWNLGPDGSIPWDGLQSTPKSIAVLSNYLVRLYRKGNGRADDVEAA